MVGPTSTSLHSDPFPNTDAAIGVRPRSPSRKEAMPPVAVHVQHHNPAVHQIPARRATRTSRALRARADLITDSNSDPPDDNSTANAYPVLLGTTRPTTAVTHSGSQSSTTSAHITVVTYGTVSTFVVLAAILVLIYILRARKRARMIQNSTNALTTEHAPRNMPLSESSQSSLHPLVECQAIRIEPPPPTYDPARDVVPLGAASYPNIERPSKPLPPTSIPTVYVLQQDDVS